MQTLLNAIKKCQVCKQALPFEPKPIIQLSSSSKILIIGQAPGVKAHQSNMAFDDLSGERLRDWLGVQRHQFYDSSLFGIMPMGFCYPGTGKSGDLPPRKECAPLWHSQIKAHMPNIQFILFIGQYAQNYYLQDKPKSLTETVKNWQQWAPHYLPLPHPSPRNNIWLAKNPWFETEVLPYLKQRVEMALSIKP